ncbi:MAG: membrane protein insertion efficiency factor YidD [Allobranchiibius sp.]
MSDFHFDPNAPLASKERPKSKKKNGCDVTDCAGCDDCGSCDLCLTTGLVTLLWSTARGFASVPVTREGSAAQRGAVRAVRSYQLNVAAHRERPVCRHQPSCSSYAIESVQRYGIGRGGWLTWRRLRRCRPGHGGFDPVP